MSRWAINFSQHPFQETWKSLVSNLAAIQVDDQTIVTAVQELARLKKVVAYLDKLLLSVDPELTPKSLWDTFHSQLQACVQQVNTYASNKQIAHIAQANEHADNLLSYLKPYNVLPNQLIGVLKTSFKAYAEEIDKYLHTFSGKAASIVGEIQDNKNKSLDYLTQSKDNKEAIEKFSVTLFEGTEGVDSIEKNVTRLVGGIETKSGEVEKMHGQLLVGESSIYSAVVQAQGTIDESKVKIIESLTAVNGQVGELNVFHKKIFGEKDSETASPKSGLKFELDERLIQLSTYDGKQQSTHDSLKLKIESLLPGATSAGLASAYGELKDGFDSPIKNYTMLFYGSLLLLVIAGVVMSVQSVHFYPALSLNFVDTAQWDAILRSLLFKAPFVAPVVWLAVFSSTRRSQYERLQQEYAHKEALATSYHSYKQQLQDLKIDTEELQKELISKAIDAIAYNASITLDGKHENKLPLQQLLDKLSIDDAKKMIDMFKTAPSKDKSA
jgi:hypothetical protein